MTGVQTCALPISNRYCPQHENYKQWINVIIDVRDIWGKIEELINSPGVKVQLDGLEEISRKYQEMKAREKAEDKAFEDRLKEIEKMEIESREKKEKDKKITEVILPGLLALATAREKMQKNNKVKYWMEKTGVIEDRGWNLQERIDESDFRFEDDNSFKKGIIPANYGCGIKAIMSDGTLVSNPSEPVNPTVTLTISSYRGSSIGAIHYYATLHFSSPSFVDNNGKPYSLWDLGIGRDQSIRMSHVLEQWEIDQIGRAHV